MSPFPLIPGPLRSLIAGVAVSALGACAPRPGSAGGEPASAPTPVRTVREAVLYIDRHISTDLRAQIIKEQNPHDMIAYHRWLGMWVRNSFDLWNPGSPLIATLHEEDIAFRGGADGASDLILRAFWAYAVGKAQAEAERAAPAPPSL